MPQPKLDRLRERLLRAGIAPRHVRKYLAELSAHFDDLVQEETARGQSPRAAQDAARARLGSDDALAAAILQRPELRSLSARYPWAVFGIGPIVTLIVVLLAALNLEAGIFILHSTRNVGSAGLVAPEWLKLLAALWNGLMTYVTPIAIALFLCWLGMRQRISERWIVTGVALVCIAGAFHEMSMRWSDLPGQSELSMGYGLAPPYSLDTLAKGFVRATVNLTVVAGVWLFWLRRDEDRLVS